MPLVDFRDVHGHEAEHYLRPAERGAFTALCLTCGSTMAERLTFGGGLLWAEEGRPRVIENLGHDPVVVRSAREHERAMKTAGVTWSTKGRGAKGQWV